MFNCPQCQSLFLFIGVFNMIGVAQQNLHSSQTLLHLWNSVFYSFLVPFVLVSILEMVVMVLNILVTCPWGWWRGWHIPNRAVLLLRCWWFRWLLCFFWLFLPLCWCLNYRSSHTQPDPWGLRCLFSSVNLCMLSEFFLLVKFLITVVALEWFFTSVKPFMHSQVVLLDEFLVTVDL